MSQETAGPGRTSLTDRLDYLQVNLIGVDEQ